MRFAYLRGGRSRPSPPPLDRILAISEARAQFESQARLTPRSEAAVVLHPMQDSDFRQIVSRAEAAVGERALEGKATVESSDDPYAFRWLVFRSARFEDVVRRIHVISGQLAGGWWDKLLCAVFSFHDDQKRPVHWVYHYKRGAFYPVAPANGNHDRDIEREHLLSAQLRKEVTVEPELGAWFPLWGLPI